MKLDKDDIDAIADAVYAKIRWRMLIVAIVTLIGLWAIRHFSLY
jgi:hypothetical protein